MLTLNLSASKRLMAIGEQRSFLEYSMGKPFLWYF